MGGHFRNSLFPTQFFRQMRAQPQSIHCREIYLFLHSSISLFQVWYRTYPQQSNGHNFTQYIRSNTNKHPYFRSIQVFVLVHFTQTWVLPPCPEKGVAPMSDLTAESFGKVELNLASTPSLECLRRKLLEESLIWLSKCPGRGRARDHNVISTLPRWFFRQMRAQP